MFHVAEKTSEDGAVFEGRVGALREVGEHWVAGVAAGGLVGLVSWWVGWFGGKGDWTTYMKTRLDLSLIQDSISASESIELVSR